MVAIARTLMGNPRLLLLNEPSEGLAPIIIDEMAQALAEVKGQGGGIRPSEQNPGFAQGLGDRACILEKGRIRYEGAMAALAADAVPAPHGWESDETGDGGVLNDRRCR